MQYIMDEKEYKESGDRNYELIRLRCDNDKIRKENDRLEKINIKYEEMISDLGKCVTVEFEPSDPSYIGMSCYIMPRPPIASINVRKHSVTEVIIKYTDVTKIYDKEKILDTIKYI